jgi:hypothetical protein
MKTSPKLRGQKWTLILFFLTWVNKSKLEKSHVGKVSVSKPRVDNL